MPQYVIVSPSRTCNLAFLFIHSNCFCSICVVSANMSFFSVYLHCRPISLCSSYFLCLFPRAFPTSTRMHCQLLLTTTKCYNAKIVYFRCILHNSTTTRLAVYFFLLPLRWRRPCIIIYSYADDDEFHIDRHVCFCCEPYCLKVPHIVTQTIYTMQTKQPTQRMK